MPTDDLQFQNLNDASSATRGATDSRSTLRWPMELGSVDGTPVNTQPYVIFGAYKRRNDLNAFRGSDPKIFAAHPDSIEYIILPLPSSALNMRQDVTYGDVSLEDIPATGSTLSDMAKAFGQWSLDLGADAALKMTEQLGIALANTATSATGFGDQMMSAVMAKVGIAQNPYTEVMFRNVEFRQHTFQWTMVPKSLHEAQTIDSILQRFKYYQLPAFRSLTGSETAENSGFLLSYPYQFDIRFSVEPTTFRLMPSVLKSLEINYGGQDQSPMFYRGDLNYPSRIGLTLTFQEVVFLIRSDIQTDQHVKREPQDGVHTSQYRF